MRKVILALCLIFLCTISNAALGKAISLVSLDAPPLVYEDEGKVKGALVDIVRECFHRMNQEVTFQIMPWIRALRTAQLGYAHGIFYAAKTEERLHYLRYATEPIWTELTVIVYRTDGIVPTSTLSNAHAIRLGTGRGYYYGPTLHRLLKSERFKTIYPVTKSIDNARILQRNRIDAFTTDYINSLQILSSPPLSTSKLEIVRDENNLPVFFDHIPTYLAFSKTFPSNDLINQFSKILREIKQDGTYLEILNKYSIPYPPIQ